MLFSLYFSLEADPGLTGISKSEGQELVVASSDDV